jgi:predicted lipoprotein with Yx(FWY)xxD motif
VRTTQPSADRQARTRPRPAPRAEPGTTVNLRDTDYGRVLFGAGNRAIYIFDRERSSRSECYGACADAWPPVITEGKPRAEGDVQAELLSTITRRDGSKQIAYNCHPLSYYVNDPPGQVLCQDVSEFGGVWLVVDRSGDAVR